MSFNLRNSVRRFGICALIWNVFDVEGHEERLGGHVKAAQLVIYLSIMLKKLTLLLGDIKTSPSIQLCTVSISNQAPLSHFMPTKHMSSVQVYGLVVLGFYWDFSVLTFMPS